MAAPETLRARQAALLLHGMPVEARDRVLSRLSATESARLHPLLRELAEFGPSSSPGSSVGPSSSGPAPLPSSASARERAASLSGALVAQAVSACAPVTVAALLRIAEWPWKDELLARCSELRRAEVKQHLRSDAPALPPAVSEALCDRLCQAASDLARNGVQSQEEIDSGAIPRARSKGSTNHRLRRILSWTP